MAGGHHQSMTARPRALRPIRAGEVVSMSYLGLPMVLGSAVVRKQLLSIQKNFDCACARCSSQDEVRLLPSPCCKGGWCVPDKEGTWVCKQCWSNVAPSQLPLVAEEKLLKFILAYTDDNEQTLHSLCSVVCQDLGTIAVGCEHFLHTWLLRDLFRVLQKRAVASLEAGGKRSSTSGSRLLARALHLLRELVARAQRQLPSCLHLFAMEALPLIRALVSAASVNSSESLDDSDGGTLERLAHVEAAQVAVVFESLLAAALGPADNDVRLLGALRGRWAAAAPTAVSVPHHSAHSVALSGDMPEVWLVHCEACGRAAVDGRRSVLGERLGSLQTPAGLELACWCSRCSFAAYCGADCEAKDRRNHAAYCMTSDGLPAQPPA